jgi:hypothetical protein
MFIEGVVPEDAPDPRLRVVDQLRQMRVPILGLVPQRHVEDWGGFGVQSAHHDDVVDEMAATLSYTFWRNPDDRADPANLAELDERTREALDRQPAGPLPGWITDSIARMRYPMLWEAVRTTWLRDPSRRDVRSALVEHVNYVLVNQFGASYPGDPHRRAGGHPLVDERSVESGFGIAVNGASVDGVRLDTDPHVFGVGADLGAGGILTAVIPRDALPVIRLAFSTRALD